MEENLTFVYPEWYRIERETEKIIKKLVSSKDLSFYLNNPNEFIRRLAILRINELKLKEGLSDLEEVLADPLESTANKELAAWTIKAISKKWGIDLFTSHELLNNYSGNEDYQEVFKITILEPESASLQFVFNPSPISNEFQFENDYTERNLEINIETNLDFREWFAAWFSAFRIKTKKYLLQFPAIMGSMFLKLVQIIWTKLLVKVKERLISLLLSTYYKHKQKFNPVSLLKNTGFYFLFIILFPVRVLRRHKSIILATVILGYCYFTFTAKGRLIALQYLGLDLAAIQSQIFIIGKKVSIATWFEVKKTLSVWLEQININDIWQNAKEFIISKLG